MKTVYVCTGGCGGKVSAEDYALGKTTCGTDGCTKHGQQFDERKECEVCSAVLVEEEAQAHNH